MRSTAPLISSDERPERPRRAIGAPPELARFEVEVEAAHLANPLLALERLLATDAQAYAQVIGDEDRFEVRVALPSLTEEDVTIAADWVHWAVHHAGVRGTVRVVSPKPSASATEVGVARLDDPGEPGAGRAPDPDLFTCEVQVDGRALLRIRGDIDPSTAERFGQGIDEAFRQAPKVVIDLRDITFMDSSGISVLVQAYRDRGEAPESLLLRAPGPFMQRLLALTGLDQILDVETDDPAILETP